MAAPGGQHRLLAHDAVAIDMRDPAVPIGDPPMPRDELQRFLLDNGVISADELKKIQTTYVAGLLRIMRFGAKEAHAKGAALEFGYLFSKGAIEQVGDRFAVNYDKMQDALNGIVADMRQQGIVFTGGDDPRYMWYVNGPGPEAELRNTAAVAWALA